MTLDHDSELFWKNYQASIRTPAQAILSLLRDSSIAIGANYRPVVWVSHSLAGLSLKEILIEAEVVAPQLFTSTRLAIFFSTPHTDEFIFFFFHFGSGDFFFLFFIFL